MTKPKKYEHIACLIQAANIETNEGGEVEFYELKATALDGTALKNWAKHFREHYMSDANIDKMLDGGMHASRKEYLLSEVFPTKEGWGPATRSGDFTEILIADLVESLLDFWVPRTRYRVKQIPNESPKGTDVVGLKFVSGNPEDYSHNDVLLTVEIKGLMKPDKAANRLQDAIDDARKDAHKDLMHGDPVAIFRVGQTLNALKHRYVEADDDLGRMAVQRFQDPVKRPFVHQVAASAVFCSSAYVEATVKAVSTGDYPAAVKPKLVVVKGDDLMHFIHAMYARAADEA